MKKMIFAAAILAVSVSSDVYSADSPDAVFRINTSEKCQTMDYFSASDAWSMLRLGLWPEDKQNQVADWLFSTENDADGKPKGIGLSLWRFNVGAGSVEQGDASQIGQGTRTECFRNADGTYNWDKQEGQRRFLKLAKERGVENFLAFLNSPPVFFTQNGLATNTGRGGTFNLKPECYDDFAVFLADMIEGVEKHDGIKFNYLCPVNEPDGHWNWTGPKQEGTPATDREIAKAVRLISKEFVKRGIDTKILVNESSDYRCMFDVHMTDWQRGHHIQAFFNPDSTATYLGDTPNVPKMMVGHSYWTNTPLDNLKNIRCQLRDSLDKYGLDFWQTELCIMGNDEEIGGGGGYDFTMKTALYVARVIHHDIVYADAKSWQWWRAVGGDYKDGLIREYPEENGLDGTVKDSKLMWALGNYSRFIRPGAKRYAVQALDDNGNVVPDGETDPKGLMMSAYKNKDGKWVAVIINYGQEDREVTVSLGKKLSDWKVYRTSDVEGEDLKPSENFKKGQGIVPKRSIVTLVKM